MKEAEILIESRKKEFPLKCQELQHVAEYLRDVNMFSFVKNSWECRASKIEIKAQQSLHSSARKREIPCRTPQHAEIEFFEFQIRLGEKKAF